MFWDEFKEICEKKNTTPSAVCLALGISKSNATWWKQGRSPRLDVVIRIADYLKVNPARLIPKERKGA